MRMAGNLDLPPPLGVLIRRILDSKMQLLEIYSEVRCGMFYRFI